MRSGLRRRFQYQLGPQQWVEPVDEGLQAPGQVTLLEIDER